MAQGRGQLSNDPKINCTRGNFLISRKLFSKKLFFQDTVTVSLTIWFLLQKRVKISFNHKVQKFWFTVNICATSYILYKNTLNLLEVDPIYFYFLLLEFQFTFILLGVEKYRYLPISGYDIPHCILFFRNSKTAFVKQYSVRQAIPLEIW